MKNLLLIKQPPMPNAQPNYAPALTPPMLRRAQYLPDTPARTEVHSGGDKAYRDAPVQMPEFSHSYDPQLEALLPQSLEKTSVNFEFKSTFKYLYSAAGNNESMTL